MLRRTSLKRMVPFHPFVVGGRPSERGALYRDSQMNAWTRIVHVAEPQRTEEEQRLYMFIQMPEHFAFQYIVWFFAALVYIRWLSMYSLELAAHKNRHFMGGMNSHELWQRNAQMAEVFDYHKDLIEATRAELGPRPEIFNAPETGGANWNDTLGMGKMR